MAKCCRAFLLEFHFSKLFFFHPNWKAFTYTPWLPYTWPCQAIYIVYRWILALYFLAWLITSGITYSNSYMIYLTNWAFITFNAYLLVAALSTTAKYLMVHFVCPSKDNDFSRNTEYEIKKPLGCCGLVGNQLSWYQMIHWLLFTLGTESSFLVMVLYWILLFPGSGQQVDGVNANTHLVNGLVALIDLCFSGIPVNFLHGIYSILYGVVYSVFTGLYFAASGNIVYEGVLDYEASPGLAAGVLIGVVIVLIPLVHVVVFYLLYLAKFWITYRLFGQARDTEVTKVQGEVDIEKNNTEQ